MSSCKLRFVVPIIIALAVATACSGPAESVVAEERVVEASVADLQSMM